MTQDYRIFPYYLRRKFSFELGALPSKLSTYAVMERFTTSRSEKEGATPH